MLSAWVPLTLALNAISRSMGEPDLYPFVLSPETDEKLPFIDTCVKGIDAPREDGTGTGAG